MSNVTNSNLKPEIKTTKSEIVTALIENVIKTKQTIKKSDKIEKPQKHPLMFFF